MQLTADEIDRFWSRVVKGPRDTDFWWSGGTAAIGGDVYGRFWVSRDGRQRVLRLHRVSWALAEGMSVDLFPVVQHVVCDNSICVHTEGTLLDQPARVDASSEPDPDPPSWPARYERLPESDARP